MRVLVTGGAGYIGSHIVRALLEAGHEAVVLDDLSTGHREFVRANGVALVEGDLGDPEALEAALETPTDAVIHVAGKALAPESVRDPAPYFRVNVQAPLLLLEAMRRRGVGRIVFSSTCAVYGVPARLPIDETCPRAPISPYGSSKLAFEHALEAYRCYGMRTLALRYFNAAGASRDGTLGELHQPETHLIPNLLKAAAEGTSFSLFGDDYPTRDGTCERDYIHVEDLARAHVQALERLDLLAGRAPLALNLGTGQGATCREVLSAVERATGSRIRVEVRPRRPGDPPALVADARRADEVLGFRTEHDLQSMVASAARFMQRQREGKGTTMAERNAPTGLRFGELAVRAGFVAQDQINRALEIQRHRDGIGESHKLLGLILLEMGAISSEQLIWTLRHMNGS